ncbi:hypothetical protein JCM5350_005219 [Sporobolomyces pararoseus]
MPPKASTSGGGGATKAKGGGKLGPIEQKLLDVGSLAPNREISQQELMQQCGMSVSPAVQDAVNGLLRKNLMQMLRTQSGLIMFRFLKKEEAKAIGAMDSEEKLVLDYIKDAGNLGIWTKTLTTKTGLARTTMTKVLKILEGRKAIKTVKSVKFPTRKIYMMAGVQPSVELTGGPWFTDNELDTELVDTLKKVVQKHLHDHSVPKNQTYQSPEDPLKTIKYRPIYPVTATPFLPGIESILAYISSTEIIQVDLQPKHVEALMDLMIYDGIVEKVFIGNQEDREKKMALAAANNGKNGKNGVNGKKNGKDKKGKRKKVEVSSEEEDSESESDDDSSRKKKKGKKGTVKRTKSGKAKKKRSKREETDDEKGEEDSSESDFDEDAPAKTSKKKKKGRGSDDEDGSGGSEEDEDEDDSDSGGKRKKKKGSSSRKKKDRSKKNRKALASDEEDSDDDPFKKDSDDEDVKPKLDEHAIGDDNQNLNDYVYRLVRPYTPVIGWTDMPCGKCPVEEFCSEPLRPRAGIVKKPTTVSGSYGDDSFGQPRLKIELEGGIQGVGMLGGAGAAVGVSLAKWGEMKGQVGKGVAPVNPRDCVYFKDWLTVDEGHEE